MAPAGALRAPLSAAAGWRARASSAAATRHLATMHATKASPPTADAAGAAGEDEAGPTMDELVSLCKRRGFIFPSSDIYNGFNGFYDYGPLGVEMKQNIKQQWWRT